MKHRPSRSTTTTSSSPFHRTALAAALSGLFVLPAAPALAGTITVGDSGCTLIDAINSANTGGGFGACSGGTADADTIVLPANSTQTLIEVHNVTEGNNGLPLITSPITIQGNGSTITRQAGSPDFRIIHVATTGDLTVQQTTLSGGVAVIGGGGIRNQGTLTLTDSTLSGNSATVRGGGLFNYASFGSGAVATATLTNSTVSGNAIGPSFSGTNGAGISSYYSQLTLAKSTVSGNSSTGGRGGGVSGVRGSLHVENSTISGNKAGVGAGLTVDYSTVDLYDSTISGNTSSTTGAGVRLFRGALVIARSLVSGNVGSDTYGGHDFYALDSTVTSSRNLFGHSGETSFQAFNGFTPGLTDINATSDGTTGILMRTALTGILGPLANNGGPTLTHLLAAGSPALNAVPSSDAGCTGTDQRGITRPQGPACDIGAVEGAAAPVGRTLSINDVSRTEGKSGMQKMQFTITLSSAATSTVTVRYATGGGTATAGTDYTATSGTATFRSGKTTVEITVPIRGDKTIEPNETLFVNLTNPSSGTTIADGQGQGTIVNDD